MVTKVIKVTLIKKLIKFLSKKKGANFSAPHAIE
jgi:hypothetical protein